MGYHSYQTLVTLEVLEVEGYSIKALLLVEEEAVGILELQSKSKLLEGQALVFEGFQEMVVVYRIGNMHHPSYIHLLASLSLWLVAIFFLQKHYDPFKPY